MHYPYKKSDNQNIFHLTGGAKYSAQDSDPATPAKASPCRSVHFCNAVQLTTAHVLNTVKQARSTLVWIMPPSTTTTAQAAAVLHGAALQLVRTQTKGLL